MPDSLPRVESRIAAPETRRLAVYATVTLFFLLLSWALGSIAWSGDPYFHRMTETAAGMIAVMIGVMALTRHYSRKSSAFLLLGAAFVGTGILDVYHGILSSPGLTARLSSTVAGVVPWSWLWSRLFLALMLICSWMIWRHERRGGTTRFLREPVLYTFSVMLMLASALVFFVVPLPRASFPDWIIPRPQELVGAALFLLALLLHMTKGEWKNSRYEHWLMIGIIVECLDHAVIMSRSVHLHDTFFNAAHLLKPAGYLCVLTGLVINTYELFARLEVSVVETEEARRLLIDAQRDLENRVHERTEQLEQWVRFTTSVIEHLPNMLFVKDAKTLRFVQFNKAGETLTGLSREEVLGLTDRDLFPQEQANSFAEMDRAVLAKGSLVEIQEEPIQTRGRGIRLLRTKKIPICDAQGVPKFLLGISEDITERKAAETQFKQVFESSPIGMLMIAENGAITLANPRIAQIFGYGCGELTGRPVETLFPERDRTIVQEQRISLTEAGASQLMAKGRALYGRRRDGTEFPVEIGLIPIETPQGRQILASIVDITEHKQAEERLMHSRDLMRSFVEHSPAAIAMLDLDLRYVAASHRWLQDYRLGDQDLIGRHHYDVFPEIRAMPEWQAIHQRCLAGAVERREEERFVRADGSENWLRWEVRPWQDVTGKVGGIILFTEDITDQQRAREALRASEERLRLTLDVSTDGFWDWDLATQQASFSSAWMRLLGLEDCEIPLNNINDWKTRIHPDDLPAAEQALTDHVEGRAAKLILAHRVRHRSGAWKWLEIRGQVTHRSPDGRPLRIMGTLTDITERKQVEAAALKNQANLAEAQQLARLGSWELDLVTDTLTWSDEIFRIFEIEPSRFGANYEAFLDAVHPDDRAAVDAAYTESVKNKSPYEIEHRLLMKDGSIKYVQERGRTDYAGDGRPLRSLGTVQDITERYRADRARFTLQHAINHGTDGLALLNASGCYTYMNPAHAAMYGYTADELLGKTWKELFHPDWASLIEQLSGPDLIESGSWQGEVVGKKRSGEPFHVEMSLAIIGADNEDGATMVCTSRDITKRKKMEGDLIAAKDAAESAARVKAEFLATMSHEIRTPMNGVIGMTGLLLDTNLTREQRDYAETVRRSGEALLAIINDILDFSKIEAGKLKLEVIDFDLRTTVEETLDLLAEQAHRKQLELIGLIDAAVPTALRGDPGRLRQILTNLIGNAVKFTERGEVVLKLSAEKPDERTATLQFEIIDTGIGISPENQARLFRSFSQADASTTRRFGGTGLGLAISKQLVELMGGEIGADSRPGEGSRFWFTVRLDRQPCAPTHVRPAEDLAGLRVCLIDDNATNRMLLEHHARAWGMTHASAEDGPNGLALIREAGRAGHPFDLAIVDMQMPGMDGMELARALRADRSIATPRLVLLTSLAQRGDAKVAQDSGFSAYLTKPIHQHQLFDCLRLVMGRSAPGSAEDDRLVTVHSLAEIESRSHGRVLLAEDNVINQKVAVKMIEKLGYHVDVVANGEEAVEALSRIPYILVFMDCQMPEMDGYEATRRIREMEGTARHTPIVAMTANAMQGDREHCLAAGMDDYISKPIAVKNIQAALERWLNYSPAASTT